MYNCTVNRCQPPVVKLGLHAALLRLTCTPECKQGDILAVHAGLSAVLLTLIGTPECK